MSNINNGGPAFPCTGVYLEIDPDDMKEKYSGVQFEHPGMSLRDYFAAKIIVSEDYSVDSAEKLVGRNMPKWNEDFMGNLIFWADFKAIVRGIEADAMIAEREKEK